MFGRILFLVLCFLAIAIVAPQAQDEKLTGKPAETSVAKVNETSETKPSLENQTPEAKPSPENEPSKNETSPADETFSKLDEDLKMSNPWEFYKWDYLTGNWGGLRTTLEDKGIAFEVVYTGEMFANVRGGIRRKTEYLDNIDITAMLNFEKMIGWKGASFFVYFLGNNGGDPSANVGDAQVVSNIEANSTWKFYEVWLEQNLFDDMLSIKLGLYDLNSEFDVIETAGLFINSSHGIGAEYAQSGQNGPSIFPVTSAAVRVKIQPQDNFYIQFAVLDGVPGDLGKPKRTQIVFKSEDGVLIAAEMAYLTGVTEDSDELYGKFALGGWYYTGKFDDILAVDNNGNPVERHGNSGIYFLAERQLYREKDDPAQGFSVFGRIGLADEKVNPAYLYTGAGLVYTGLIPGRDKDQIGFAVAAVHSGRDFEEAMENQGMRIDSSEITLEFTYLIQVTPWFTIQPDLQYVINPGVDPALNNALALGTRFTVSF